MGTRNPRQVARRGRIALVGFSVVGALLGLGLLALGTTTGFRLGGIGTWAGTAALLWCALGGRRRRTTQVAPEVTTGSDAGIALPVRPGYAAVLALGALVMGALSLAFGMTIIDDPRAGSGRYPPLTVVVAGVVFLGYGAWIGVSALRGRGRVVLSPHGLVYTSLAARTRRWDWTQVRTARLEPETEGQTIEVVDREGAPTRIPWQGQRWPADRAAEAIRWYANHAGARVDLTRPGALDRWR